MNDSPEPAPEGDARRFLANDGHPSDDQDATNDQEVCSLAWAALDGNADPAELARLEELIESEGEAKQAYQSVLALEFGLKAFFAALPATEG